MKKVLVLSAVLGLGMLAFSGCSKKEEAKETAAPQSDTVPSTTKVQMAAATYYCPMDTEITSDHPAKCSKCGMDLIEKKPETK